MTNPPLVYCETNWIVALAFPHHAHFAEATKLRDAAKQGKCVLKVPTAALLEAKNPLGYVGQELAKRFAQLRDDFAKATTNGWKDTGGNALAIGASNAINEYAARPPLSILDELEKDSSVTILSAVPTEIEVLHELRAKCDLRGKDVVDLYLLAAIIHDRRQSSSGPAVFFSTNKKEYKNKVPEEIFANERLVWREDFDLASALGAWKAKYP